MPGAPIPSYTVGSIRRFLDSFDLACTLRRQPAGRGYCPPRQRLPSHCPPPPPTTVYPVSAWPYLHVAFPPSLARGARNVCLVGDKPNVPRIGVEGMQGSMVTRLRLCIERAPSPPPRARAHSVSIPSLRYHIWYHLRLSSTKVSNVVRELC